MSQATAPKISILGDGISTFEGYTPKVGSFYSPSYASYSGFNTAKGTWWMQAIEQLGGRFLCNNSFTGSYVCYTGHYSAALPGRIRTLATETEKPDVIFIYTGLNDAANAVPTDLFQRDYEEMLSRVQKFFPEAKVWVGTLMVGDAPTGGRPYYIEPECFETLEDYNAVIRDCAKKFGVNVADLAELHSSYETVNGLHPNKKGMTQFAALWLEAMKKAEK